MELLLCARLVVLAKVTKKRRVMPVFGELPTQQGEVDIMQINTQIVSAFWIS